ncbi:Hypothetical predicted protein [Mytilus galloprovincialis]|uniref:Uncharacterized protein n=1 Tax=Mytilus galloprovincialis TaxID=29158 RepID=A0A8B6EZV2_MYTGA|nr:Hypothetical predicted protein [Mytilus galloprovincialis]
MEEFFLENQEDLDALDPPPPPPAQPLSASMSGMTYLLAIRVSQVSSAADAVLKNSRNVWILKILQEGIIITSLAAGDVHENRNRSAPSKLFVAVSACIHATRSQLPGEDGTFAVCLKNYYDGKDRLRQPSPPFSESLAKHSQDPR